MPHNRAAAFGAAVTLAMLSAALWLQTPSTKAKSAGGNVALHLSKF